jgi:hypothetical protein
MALMGLGIVLAFRMRPQSRFEGNEPATGQPARAGA